MPVYNLDQFCQDSSTFVIYGWLAAGTTHYYAQLALWTTVKRSLGCFCVGHWLMQQTVGEKIVFFLKLLFYLAERRQSLGYDWHPLCLKCEECGKILQPGTITLIFNILKCP